MMKPNPSTTTLVTSPKGRPVDERLASLFSKLCAHIESQDECQYFIEELENIMKEVNEDGDISFSRITLKIKLKQHYGEQIVITSAAGKHDIVCFKELAHKILRDQWRSDK